MKQKKDRKRSNESGSEESGETSSSEEWVRKLNDTQIVVHNNFYCRKGETDKKGSMRMRDGPRGRGRASTTTTAIPLCPRMKEQDKENDSQMEMRDSKE